MHGNIPELTSDRSLRPYAIYSVTDPTSPKPDSSVSGRVARGGDIRGGNISSANQLITTSVHRAFQGYGGIRLALTLPAEGLRASAGLDHWGVAGEAILLEGSASIGEALSYEWLEHPDNPAIGRLSDPESPLATFEPTEIGTYHFLLTVADDTTVSEPDEIEVVSADGTVSVQVFDDVTMDFVWIEPGTFTRR